MELQQVMDNLKGMLKAISKEKKLTDLALGPSGGGLSPNSQFVTRSQEGEIRNVIRLKDAILKEYPNHLEKLDDCTAAVLGDGEQSSTESIEEDLIETLQTMEFLDLVFGEGTSQAMQEVGKLKEAPTAGGTASDTGPTLRRFGGTKVELKKPLGRNGNQVFAENRDVDGPVDSIERLVKVLRNAQFTIIFILVSKQMLNDHSLMHIPALVNESGTKADVQYADQEHEGRAKLASMKEMDITIMVTEKVNIPLSCYTAGGVRGSSVVFSLEFLEEHQKEISDMLEDWGVKIRARTNSNNVTRSGTLKTEFVTATGKLTPFWMMNAVKVGRLGQSFIWSTDASRLMFGRWAEMNLENVSMDDKEVSAFCEALQAKFQPYVRGYDTFQHVYTTQYTQKQREDTEGQKISELVEKIQARMLQLNITDEMQAWSAKEFIIIQCLLGAAYYILGAMKNNKVAYVGWSVERFKEQIDDLSKNAAIGMGENEVKAQETQQKEAAGGGSHVPNQRKHNRDEGPKKGSFTLTSNANFSGGNNSRRGPNTKYEQWLYANAACCFGGCKGTQTCNNCPHTGMSPDVKAKSINASKGLLRSICMEHGMNDENWESKYQSLTTGFFNQVRKKVKEALQASNAPSNAGGGFTVKQED